MPTLGNGEAQALIQGQKNALLQELVGYAAQTSGTLVQVADGNGLLNATHDMNGTYNLAGLNLSHPTNATAGVLKGFKDNIISGSGATVTLTAAQSGSTVLFDRAAGIVYTLPAPVVGLTYTFIVSTSVTSNNHKIITDAGTTLLIGGVALSTATPTATAFYANGTTHLAVTMNGTTTGGLIGAQLQFTCVTSTLWNVTGMSQGSGTIATPFTTS